MAGRPARIDWLNQVGPRHITHHGQTEYYEELMSNAGSLLAAAPNVEMFDTVG